MNHKNLPSNHTICEVSERDSEIDERTKTIKRNEIKNTIGTNQSTIKRHNEKETTMKFDAKRAQSP